MAIGVAFIFLIPILIFASLIVLLAFKQTREKIFSAARFLISKLWLFSLILIAGFAAYELILFIPPIRYQLDEKYCQIDSECHGYTYQGSPEDAVCNCTCTPKCVNREFQVSCKDTCNLLCSFFDQETMSHPQRFTLTHECMCIESQCTAVRNVTKACETVCNDVIETWNCDAARLKQYEADFIRYDMMPPYSTAYNQTWEENDCYDNYNCSCKMFGPEGVIY